MLDNLRTRLARHQQYRRTLRELQDLSFDLGLVPDDLPRLAHETVYGR